MAKQEVFQRYEIKYLISASQKQKLLNEMVPYMALDRYGRTTIRNIYFDTDNYRLIRRSLEKPVYKEKLRLRSYRQVGPDDEVFVELKKKYRSIVYKRRMTMPEHAAMDWICSGEDVHTSGQIAKEINYFVGYYQALHPTVFLSYEREAYYCRDGGDFRVTFDSNILCRSEQLSLGASVWGIPLLEEGEVLMEIKTSGGIPLWMTHILTQERIYKTSFSKYGRAYEKTIYPKTKGDYLYA